MFRWCFAAGLLLAYIAVIAQSSAIGLGDTSAHLARAYILADLIFHHGNHFGDQFRYHFLAVPYVLPDLLLAASVDLLGPRITVASWTVLTFLSVPAALLLYLHVASGTKWKAFLKDDGTLFLLLCAAYLSTDFFFVVGFFAFRVGLAFVIAILAVMEALRRKWSKSLFVLYCVILATAYLVHLSTLLFVATIVVVSASVRLWFRSSSVDHELLLLAPVVALFLWHFGVAAHYGPPTDLAGSLRTWGTLSGKLLWSTRNFHRYGGRLDHFLLFLYVASLLMLLRTRAWRGACSSPPIVESLALATAFVAMYLVLPFATSDATYVDIRALAPATLFVLLACLRLPRVEPLPTRSWDAPALTVISVIALSTLNLVYLGRHFAELSNWSRRVRSLFVDIPRGAHVLPIETLPHVWPYMDPSAIAVIDRQASIPYLFSAETRAPQIYFHYNHYFYAPPDNWYIRRESSSVDWGKVACTYQDILVTRPFDPRLIRIATEPVVKDSGAELLAIDPRECNKPHGLGSTEIVAGKIVRTAQRPR